MPTAKLFCICIYH